MGGSRVSESSAPVLWVSGLLTCCADVLQSIVERGGCVGSLAGVPDSSSQDLPDSKSLSFCWTELVVGSGRRATYTDMTGGSSAELEAGFLS